MTPEQRQALADLLIEWEDAFKQGRDTPADVLCKAHPELAETLARRIAALKRLAWLDDRLENDDGEPGDDAPEDCRHAKILAGRYRLDQRIATGGFAEVWQAYDEELQRIIAVKIPKRTVVGAADSFLAEARRVARLKHPAILPVYDVGIDGTDCFFVSEYVEGGSLADRLTRGNLSADQACRWIATVADALEHAHAAGVIHRDVKPSNILIDAHDRAVLADFGIAQSSLKTGSFAPSLGTLRYMSPEQLDGKEALPQSDVYSLAVVLHEVLTGKPPYSSGDPNTLRREIGSGAKVSRDVPRHLAPVLRKALHKDPGQRCGSAAEFSTAVRTPQKHMPWLLPLGAVATVALGALLSLRSGPSPAPPVDAAGVTNPTPAEKPQRTVFHREIPYPLPPYNRREWVATSPDKLNGRVFRFNPADGWWSECDASGKSLFSFKQTRLTDDHIELKSVTRAVWIRLGATTCEICDNPTFAVTGEHMRGSWINGDASPFPAPLDMPVTFHVPRNTLAYFLQALSDKTGVPVALNLAQLELQGITTNQWFGLDVQDKPAHEVLLAILDKADPDDRLRAVLKAKDDGSIAIDITTKQALEK